MDERGRGGHHRQLDPMEGEIDVYHIPLPAVLADALADPFASCLPDCRSFKLVHTFDKQPNTPGRRHMPFTAVTHLHPRWSDDGVFTLLFRSTFRLAPLASGEVSYFGCQGFGSNIFCKKQWGDGSWSSAKPLRPASLPQQSLPTPHNLPLLIYIHIFRYFILLTLYRHTTKSIYSPRNVFPRIIFLLKSQ